RARDWSNAGEFDRHVVDPLCKRFRRQGRQRKPRRFCRLLQQPESNWRQLRRLAQPVGKSLLSAWCRQPGGKRSGLKIRPQGNVQGRLTRTEDRFAQVSRKCIDRAALDASSRDHGFAADRETTKRDRDAFQRLALETLAKNIRPGDSEAAIGRLERSN